MKTCHVQVRRQTSAEKSDSHRAEMSCLHAPRFVISCGASDICFITARRTPPSQSSWNWWSAIKHSASSWKNMQSLPSLTHRRHAALDTDQKVKETKEEMKLKSEPHRQYFLWWLYHRALRCTFIFSNSYSEGHNHICVLLIKELEKQTMWWETNRSKTCSSSSIADNDFNLNNAMKLGRENKVPVWNTGALFRRWMDVQLFAFFFCFWHEFDPESSTEQRPWLPIWWNDWSMSIQLNVRCVNEYFVVVVVVLMGDETNELLFPEISNQLNTVLTIAPHCFNRHLTVHLLLFIYFPFVLFALQSGSACNLIVN